MILPTELELAIENEIGDIKRNQLIEISESISEKYRNESGQGKRLIKNNNEAVTYSIVRMPATYGSVSSALNQTLELCDCNIESVIDVGAGTGAATWAADSLLDLKKVVCLEREEAMRNIGQKLMNNNLNASSNPEWREYDLIKDEVNEKADLVLASYVLNELASDERIKAVDKLWKASNKILLIVEPGTPAGYSNLKEIREHVLEKGGHIVAPCPHENTCEMDTWCHFTCRIPRSKLHKEIKKGEVPYEDEKFAYLAISHDEYRKSDARILRHPIIKKGRVSLDICSDDGIKTIELYKKDGDLYKKARKAKWGDEVSIKG